MGSGSSKSARISDTPSSEKQLKGILKNGIDNPVIQETVAVSRKDAPAIEPPTDSMNKPDAEDDIGVPTETVRDDPEFDEGEDENDGDSQGSAMDPETLKFATTMESEEEKLSRLERLHQDGKYSITRFSEAPFKVFNDYLLWATETGSRGERVVMPDESMKIEQKQLIEDTMVTLRDAETYTGNDQLHCLLTLCKMSDVRQKDYVDLVTELGFAELFMKIWTKLHEVDINDQIENPATYLAINMLLDATQGYTDLGSTLCHQMGEHCVPALLEVFDDRFYEVNALNGDSKKLRWMSRREFLKRVLSVLYHCIRHHLDNKTVFREKGASAALKPYLKCRFLILRVKAIFILAFIVTEDENAHLNTTNTNIDFIVKILSKALNEPHHYSAHYNFSSIQVADAMKYLAANDDNKVKFVAAGALSRIVSMMQDENPLTEQRSGLDALWILSFHQSNKAAILKEKGCLEIVKRNRNNRTLCRPCEAILWNVGEETHATLTKKAKDSARKAKPLDKEASFPGEPEGKESGLQAAAMQTADNNNQGENYYDAEEEEISTNHVMISYQWDVQKQILKVKELLQADGYKVWMDVDQMGGSTLEAMASAVENAVVVLICFSEKYKNSPACRTEAEYTFKLNKAIVPLKVQNDYQADGWLGIMLGTKYYITMSTMDEVIENVDRLKRELASRGRLPTNSIRHMSVDEDPTTGGVRLRRHDSKRMSKRDPVSAKNAATWSNDDVNTWLTRNSLAELKNRLEGYDGEGILGLKAIASHAPEFFYKEVKNELGLKSLREVIRFKQALDDIL